jgi:hypothetical protein
MEGRTANLAAQLARRFTMWSRQGTGSAMTLLVAILGLVWFALAAWGTLLLEGQEGQPRLRLLADALYAPFTLLAPDPEYVKGGEWPWQWEVGRIAGFVLTIVGVIKIFQRWLGPAMARQLVRFQAQGHKVLVGTDGSADALAMATSGGGTAVVLVDSSLDPTASRADLLAYAGVVHVRGADLSDSLLRGAAVKRSASVTAWGARDVDSLALALELQRTLTHCKEIGVRISSPVTQRALRFAPDLLAGRKLCRLRPVSQVGTACRLALSGSGLVAEAKAGGQRRVHVRLVGGGPALEWAAELVLRHNWSIQLGPPAVTIEPRGADWTIWWDMQETFREHAQTVFEPEWLPTLEMAGAGHAGGEATRYLVDTGDDEATLATGFQIAALLKQRGSDASVQLLLHESGLVTEYLDSTELPFAAPILTDRPRSLVEILERREDRQAAQLHLDYVHSRSEEGLPLDRDWQELAESFVQANRAAADHRSIKLWDLAAAGGMTDFAAKGAGADLTERLAAVEHRRWCADRLLDGWIPGVRDDARCMHPSLVPWDKLSEPEREKDREQVRMLAENGLE